MPALAPSPERDHARENRLRAALSAANASANVLAFHALASTMDEAHLQAEQGAPSGTAVLAGRQTGGRGRLGRVWNSPEGGLYVSFVLRTGRPASEIPQLSLVAGLAVAETVASLVRSGVVSVKWPNDVLIDDKKVAGILIEARNNAVIIGMGINVKRSNDLPDTATSLEACGAATDTDAVFLRLATDLSRWANQWQEQGFAPVHAALRPLLNGLGRMARLSAGSETIEGQAMDIDDGGRLVIRLDSGLLRAFSIGEVSILR